MSSQGSPVETAGDTSVESCASQGEARDNKTNVSCETACLKIDADGHMETLVEALASEAVTVDSFSDAEICFKKRDSLRFSKNPDAEDINSIDWDQEVKFKANNSDTVSFEIEEILSDKYGDLGLNWLFKRESKEVEHVLEEVLDRENALWWLFNNENENACVEILDRENALWWLFQESHWDDGMVDIVHLEKVVKEKKKNKLNEIFKRDSMISTPKRKRSPEDIAISKFRRMTISTDGSPQLKQAVKTRTRSNTVGPRRNKNDKPIVKQALISEFMMRIIKEM